ncbi:hypothetical protein [Enterococcus durans]|nr:hypothetical protein [Enterococcus durans]
MRKSFITFAAALSLVSKEQMEKAKGSLKNLLVKHRMIPPV